MFAAGEAVWMGRWCATPRTAAEMKPQNNASEAAGVGYLADTFVVGE